MEIVMRAQYAVPSGHPCLRFVFDDSVVSESLAPDATFGDVACRWSEVSMQHQGMPVAIDITMPQ
jgi:hypothetical protein